MTKQMPLNDFRAVRCTLESSAFAFRDEGDDPPPSDQIDLEVWHGIMHLPDDVAIRISDHDGTRLRLLYMLSCGNDTSGTSFATDSMGRLLRSPAHA